MLAVKVSLFSNLVLFLIKGVTLIIVNSLAIMADLGISFISLGISILLYYAIKMSNKPADVFHNYGYGKVENVSEAIEGVILIGLALAMSFQAVMHLLRPGEISSPVIGLICSMLGVVINFWGARFILGLAKQHASPALEAEGIHFRLEGMISLAITLSFIIFMVLSRTGFGRIAIYVDPAATLIVSGAITLPSLHILKQAFMKLLDASIGEAGQMDVIKALAKHYNRYCSFNSIKTRTAGRKQFIDLHLVMPEHMSVKNAHHIATAVKHDLLNTISESEVTVHIEPCGKDCHFIKQDGKCPYSG